jgi:hypothetical protein
LLIISGLGMEWIAWPPQEGSPKSQIRNPKSGRRGNGLHCACEFCTHTRYRVCRPLPPKRGIGGRPKKRGRQAYSAMHPPPPANRNGGGGSISREKTQRFSVLAVRLAAGVYLGRPNGLHCASTHTHSLEVRGQKSEVRSQGSGVGDLVIARCSHCTYPRCNASRCNPKNLRKMKKKR